MTDTEAASGAGPATEALYSKTRTHGYHVTDANDCREYVIGECVLTARAAAPQSDAVEDGIHGKAWLDIAIGRAETEAEMFWQDGDQDAWVAALQRLNALRERKDAARAPQSDAVERPGPLRAVRAEIIRQARAAAPQSDAAHMDAVEGLALPPYERDDGKWSLHDPEPYIPDPAPQRVALDEVERLRGIEKAARDYEAVVMQPGGGGVAIPPAWQEFRRALAAQPAPAPPIDKWEPPLVKDHHADDPHRHGPDGQLVYPAPQRVALDAEKPTGWLRIAGEEPHRYSPDYMAMGDCKRCGHVYEQHTTAAPDRADTGEEDQ